MLALTPVIFWRGALEPFESCKTAIVQLSALALFVTAGIVACAGAAGIGPDWVALRRRLNRFVADPVSSVMLLGAIAAVVSTVNSISPLTSWHGHHEYGMGLATQLGLLTIYFATRAVCHDGRGVRVLVVAVALALIPATLYALVQAARLDPFAWDLPSPFAGWTRPIGTLGHPNYLAGYTVMALPLVIWLAYRCAQEGRRVLALGLVVLTVAGFTVVVLSLSRAAWLAGGVISMLVICLHFHRITRQRRIILLAAFTVPVTAMTVEIICFAPLRERLSQVTVFGGRAPLWQGAWSIFHAHPWTGCGLETFDVAFRQHGIAAFWRIEWGMSVTRAHDDLLNTLATQGLLGALAYLLLAAALAWAIRRAWDLGPSEDRTLVLALACAVVAWYVQNVFGFPVAPTASLFVVLAAVLSRRAWPRISDEPVNGVRGALVVPLRFRLLGVMIIVAGSAVAYFLVAMPFFATCACQRGDAIRESDPEAALLCHERSVQLDPKRDLLWLKLGSCALVAAECCPDTAKRRRLLLRAREADECACRLVPVKSENHANLALILFALARERLVSAQDVVAAYDEALALDPENTFYLAEAGRAAVSLGLSSRGRDYIERGLRIDPDLGPLNANLAALELAGRHYYEAERLIEKALTGRWYDSRTYHGAQALRCLIYLDTGRTEQALRLADDLLSWKDSLPFRRLRARALEKLGRRVSAAKPKSN
jgi:O-antigen ligase